MGFQHVLAGQRIARLVSVPVVVLLVVLFLASEASATKRILLVGDSWTGFPWKDGSFQTVLNYNYGYRTYEVEGTYTAIGGTTSAFWASNAAIDAGVFPDIPTPPGVGPTNGLWGALDRISYALMTNPTIDIVHLSTGGVDLLTQWKANWTTAQEQDLWTSVRGNTQVIVDHIKSVRPDIKIVWCGYDYVNITETVTYAWGLPVHYFPEFSFAAYYSAQELGFPVDPFDVFVNLSNNQRLNLAFGTLAQHMIFFAQQNANVAFVNNFGICQVRGGYEDSLGTLWGPGQVAYPGGAPAYSPLLGGNPGFGTAPVFMNETSDGIDPIHLNAQGYKYIFDNCVSNYYNAWLTQP